MIAIDRCEVIAHCSFDLHFLDIVFFLKCYFYIQQNEISCLGLQQGREKESGFGVGVFLRKDNYFNSCPQGKTQVRVKLSLISSWINLFF